MDPDKDVACDGKAAKTRRFDQRRPILHGYGLSPPHLGCRRMLDTDDLRYRAGPAHAVKDIVHRMHGAGYNINRVGMST